MALVTGAGSGIGAAVARKLTVEGMQVVGADCNVEKVQVSGTSDNWLVNLPQILPIFSFGFTFR